MVDFRLYAIGDRTRVPNLTDFIREASNAGLRAFQLREKDLPGKAVFELSSAIRQAAPNCNIFVNDRADVALASGANGIHLPEASWPLDRVREAFPSLIMGASVHSLERACEAERCGADFIVFGPVFETPSKQKLGIPARGLDALEEIIRSVTIPVFAIGGMTPIRARACRNHGSSGVAAMSDLLCAPNLSERIEEYREALGTL